VLFYRVIAQELATLGAAYGLDEQREPVARLADGSVCDRAVSPTVAQLLFQASTSSASASAHVLASGPTVHDADDCFDRGDIAERTSATATERWRGQV
jgi:hypothetical protein